MHEPVPGQYVKASRAAPKIRLRRLHVTMNELLREEQIAMMQYAASTKQVEATRNWHRLDAVASLLAGHPYPHRPFISTAALDAECPFATTEPILSNMIDVWENEGGHLVPRAARPGMPLSPEASGRMAPPL